MYVGAFSFSPPLSSGYTPGGSLLGGRFVYEDWKEVSALTLPLVERMDQKGRREVPCESVSDEGWVLTKTVIRNLKKNKQILFFGRGDVAGGDVSQKAN